MWGVNELPQVGRRGCACRLLSVFVWLVVAVLLLYLLFFCQGGVVGCLLRRTNKTVQQYHYEVNFRTPHYLGGLDPNSVLASIGIV